MVTIEVFLEFRPKKSVFFEELLSLTLIKGRLIFASNVFKFCHDKSPGFQLPKLKAAISPGGQQVPAWHGG